MVIKGTKLARAYYHRDLEGAPDRDLLVGGRVDDNYFVTDTYTFFFLIPEEYKEFLQRWNDYSKTSDLPRDIDGKEVYSLNKGFMDKYDEIVPAMKKHINADGTKLEYSNTTISFENEWKTLFDIFSEEAAIFELDDKYMGINRKILNSLFSMIYKSKIDEFFLTAVDNDKPAIIHADDRKLGAIMPIRPDNLRDRQVNSSNILEHL